MPYTVETVTSKGSEIFATLADHLMEHLTITGCYAVKNTVSINEALASGNILNESSWSSTDWLHTTHIEMSGVTTDTQHNTSSLMVYAQFKSDVTFNGSWTTGDKQVKTFYLHGHLDSSPNTEYVLGVASDTKSTRIPEVNDIINIIEVRFTLTFTPLDADSTITVPSDNDYVLRSEYNTVINNVENDLQTLTDRVVTTHAEGSPTTGENQSIYGNKTFKGTTIFDGSVGFNSSIDVEGGIDIENGSFICNTGAEFNVGLDSGTDIVFTNSGGGSLEYKNLTHTPTSYTSLKLYNGQEGQNWIVSSSLYSSNTENSSLNYSKLTTSTSYNSTTSNKEQSIKLETFIDTQTEHAEPFSGSIELKTEGIDYSSTKSTIDLTADAITVNLIGALDSDIKIKHPASEGGHIYLSDSEDNNYPPSPPYDHSYLYSYSDGSGAHAQLISETKSGTSSVAGGRAMVSLNSRSQGFTSVVLNSTEREDDSSAYIWLRSYTTSQEPYITFGIYDKDWNHHRMIYGVGSLYPEDPDTQSIGTPSNHFQDLYVNNIHTPNPTSTSIPVGSIALLYIETYIQSSTINPGTIITGNTTSSADDYYIWFASIINSSFTPSQVSFNRYGSGSSGKLSGKYAILSHAEGYQINPKYAFFVLAMRIE